MPGGPRETCAGQHGSPRRWTARHRQPRLAKTTASPGTPEPVRPDLAAPAEATQEALTQDSARQFFTKEGNRNKVKSLMTTSREASGVIPTARPWDLWSHHHPGRRGLSQPRTRSLPF